LFILLNLWARRSIHGHVPHFSVRLVNVLVRDWSSNIRVPTSAGGATPPFLYVLRPPLSFAA
jgi:hypothetical protein